MGCRQVRSQTVPVGVIQMDLHLELVIELPHIEPGLSQACALALFFGHSCQFPLIVLSADMVHPDLGFQCLKLLGDVALIHRQAIGTTGKNGPSTLPDGKRTDVLCLKNGFTKILVHGQQAVIQVKDNLLFKYTEVYLACDLKLAFQFVVFLTESHVRTELVQGNAIEDFAWQIYVTIAFVADIPILNLSLKQASEKSGLCPRHNR